MDPFNACRHKIPLHESCVVTSKFVSSSDQVDGEKSSLLVGSVALLGERNDIIHEKTNIEGLDQFGTL